MAAFSLLCSGSVSPLRAFTYHFKPQFSPPRKKNPRLSRTSKTLIDLLIFRNSRCIHKMISSASGFESSSIDGDENDEPCGSSSDLEAEMSSGDGVKTKIEKLGNNSRRIKARIRVKASLETIWRILTDYERLADFLPGLAVSQLLEKNGNRVRLFQVGEQDLALGLKFKAKGTVDCYENDLELLPFGQRRDIEFRMVEGDFQTFEGTWSIMQVEDEENKDNELSELQETILSYTVDVEPKLWLPVGLVEGRLCNEIVVNLQCIREEAQRMVQEELKST